MRLFSKILLLSLSSALLIPAFAQQKKTDKKDQKQTKAPTRIPVSFGGIMADSSLTKEKLLQLTGKKLKAEMAGATIDHFYFSMTQRNLYEDSIGNLIIIAEPFTELCKGDSIPMYLRENLAINGKPGDTTWVEAIKIKTVDGRLLDGRTLKMTLIP